jgi:hypothetical protein
MMIQKMNKLFLPIIIISLILGSGCKRKNADVMESAKQIGDAMCRNIEAMNKIRAANPNDTATINKLQGDAKKVQIEMTILYQEFKKKYGEKANDKEFNKEFSNELRKAMLNCPSLSKEDREQFMKDLEQ